jgi:RNA polymerase sigma-70 factor (ECF subfamily)
MGRWQLDIGQKRAAFEATAVPYMQALFNTALRLTGTPPDAADLVQETFLRAYRTFENFQPGTNAKAWLFKILYSIHVNRYHHAWRRPPTVSLDELEERFHLTLEAPAEPEGWEERWAPQVERALRTLNEEFRAAVILVDVEGLSYEEAAVAIGCPVGTLRSRLFRGRRQLFDSLRDYAKEAGYPTGSGREP